MFVSGIIVGLLVASLLVLIETRLSAQDRPVARMTRLQREILGPSTSERGAIQDAPNEALEAWTATLPTELTDDTDG